MAADHAEVGPLAAVPLRTTLPVSAYSIEAVHRASYALMSKIDVRILSSVPDIVCQLGAVTDEMSAGDIERAFIREVVDQQLRISIEARTESYRDLILGLAFSRTGLQDG